MKIGPTVNGKGKLAVCLDKGRDGMGSDSLIGMEALWVVTC